MSVCKHIADTLKGFITDSGQRQLSLAALQQINLDLVQCESKWVPVSSNASKLGSWLNRSVFSQLL